MNVALEFIGLIWTMAGVLVVLAAFSGQGITTFMGGVGLGIFPGLVLVALGRILGRVSVLVERLAPKEHVAPPLPEAARPPSSAPERPLTARSTTRPPWEKESQ